jgi:hypothetical protein
MEPFDLLRLLSETLERLRIPYYVTGSMASGAHGDPRFTNDIDIVLALDMNQIDELCAAFPESDFYWSRAATVLAVRTKFQFNILHPESGLKADMIVSKDDAFSRSALSRAVRLSDPAFTAWFASPEDIILNKLLFYRAGGSDKHIRDIAGVLKIQAERIDRAYIEGWVERFGLHAEWQLALERSTTPFP